MVNPKESVYTLGAGVVCLVLFVFGPVFKGVMGAPGNKVISVEQLARKGNGVSCVAVLVQNGHGSGGNYVEVPLGFSAELGDYELQKIHVAAEPGPQVLEFSKSSRFIEHVKVGGLGCEKQEAPVTTSAPVGSVQKVGYCYSELRGGVYIVEGSSTHMYQRPLTKDEYVIPDC